VLSAVLSPVLSHLVPLTTLAAGLGPARGDTSPSVWPGSDLGSQEQPQTTLRNLDRGDRVIILMITTAMLMTMMGCASWHTDADRSRLPRGLPPPKRHPGGVVLETAFVSIHPSTFQIESLAADSDNAAEEASANSPSDQSPVIDIWNVIDETAVVPEVRQALRRNGLRIGKAQMVGGFAEHLQQVRRTPSPTSEVLEVADVESDLSHQARQITCRIGKRYELPVRQVATEDQVILMSLGNQAVGQTLSQAQPLFALRAVSADARSVRLSLKPEIQHGAMRQTWVGNDAALRIENRRDSIVIDDLETEVSLDKGSVLVAGCIEPAFGLGSQFFTGKTAEGDRDQVLLIIRVVELPELIVP